MDEKKEIDIISVQANQPIINIGVIGAIANGKTTLVKEITGIMTQKRSSELEKNITIRLGCANAKIFICEKCRVPMKYQSLGSSIMEANCKNCGEKLKLERHISLIDCPGHNMLMSTMLNGAC